MGRVPSFDKETVLTQARNLFWEHGFEATAVPDLERATGLKRSSIYHAFGSKKELFDAVVENYLNTAVRPLLEKITRDDAPTTALLTYFETVSQSIKSTEAHPGCLLIAAANSPIGQDQSVQTAITGYYAELFEALKIGLARLQPALPDTETNERARQLTALTVTALALARTDKNLALVNLETACKLAST